jgi:hypothetical protein
MTGIKQAVGRDDLKMGGGGIYFYLRDKWDYCEENVAGTDVSSCRPLGGYVSWMYHIKWKSRVNVYRPTIQLESKKLHIGETY